MALYVIAALSIGFCCVYLWFKNNYRQWDKYGLKGPTPLPVVGNLLKVLLGQEALHDFTKRTYNEYPNEPVVAFYRGSDPALLIRDLELIKHILVKDFNSFQDRVRLPRRNDAFNENLFMAEKETWRVLRQKLTPIFTSGKLKNMMPLIQTCVDNYMRYIDSLIENNVECEIRNLASKYTLEVIGSVAFGVEMEAFTNEKNVYSDIANELFSPSTFTRILRVLRQLIPGFSRCVKFLKIDSSSAKLRGFFLGLIKNIINEREGKPKVRKDLMDLMIELKEKGTVEKRESDRVLTLEMNDERIAAQALIFYAAGFETSAATMSFLINELALHQDIQERLYKEVTKVLDKYDGKIIYESLNEMTYLEMVLDETLRKYPIVGDLFRVSIEDYSYPKYNLKIPKETNVFIPVLAIQRDEQYFKNPDVFDPERFSPENKPNLRTDAYMPFGEGPRHCIGLRFAKVQSMMGLAALITRFKIEPCPKTKEIVDFDPKGQTLITKEGIYVKISRRS